MRGFLSNQFKGQIAPQERISVLKLLPLVDEYLGAHPHIKRFSESLNSKRMLMLLELIAIRQIKPILNGVDEGAFQEETLIELLDQLVKIDYFYREIGGLAGYQAKILELMEGKQERDHKNRHFHPPSFLDISRENEDVKELIDWGIDHLEEVAEIYPLGGAADRLHLLEENTGAKLPAAKLPFLGKTLLELLIRDLSAREYLYYQKTKKQVITPIAIMTSHEKDNHNHVKEIFEEHQYFGRPKESIRFFSQPLVPAVDEEGNWCMKGPLEPLLKPGGHGAIWKLAKDEGIFDWLKGLGRTKALVRQINNPIAGLDYGLLAFTGIGCKKKMVFGFASCPRLLEAAEGVNVLVEHESKLVLTNIEYCDFTKFGIEDLPLKEGEPYSRFSSNTNILFIDLEAVLSAIDSCPFPGLLINLKKTKLGKEKEIKMARLESTMQNIADVFVEEKGDELKTERTFVTYNLRHKTISTAKKAYLPGKTLRETPENCFFDLIKANRELLVRCGFDLPPERKLEEYLEKGPEFVFLYHPSLGPLYSLIEKKLQKGAITTGSELLLNLADLNAKNLILKGSLQIIAEQPWGHFEDDKLIFSDQIGSCILENVTIENRGVNWEKSRPFWKMDLEREESVKIILKGKSKFIARNLHLEGTHTFVVEDGKIMKIL